MLVVRGIEFSTAVCIDVLLRIVLALVFLELEVAEPFNRKIHEEELWLYRNPRTDSYIPASVLWPLVFITPTIVIFLSFFINKDRVDLHQAVLCVTLALGVNGIVTDTIKLIVGRPRPDFFWRCFPDGQINPEFRCTGNPVAIRDGRKSFPSGHSSFAFASFGFIALYIAGKLHTFSMAGKGQSWKLCSFLLPLCVALAVAISRTCDYHHHWQDIVIGAAIGFCLTYMCYRHYYPPLGSQMCHKPYFALNMQSQLENVKNNKNDQIKWI